MRDEQNWHMQGECETLLLPVHPVLEDVYAYSIAICAMRKLSATP